MARRKHTPERVINELRQAEMAMSEGNTVVEANSRMGVTEQYKRPTIASGPHRPLGCRTPMHQGIVPPEPIQTLVRLT